MFKKGEQQMPAPSQEKQSTTVVGTGAHFNGVLKVNGSLRIDGEVEGEISATGSVIVGSGGVVKAEVVADSAVVAGYVRGVIRAKGKVELQKGSKLEGDVHASSFKIEDGAFFQGNCKMGDGTATKERKDAALKVVGKE